MKSTDITFEAGMKGDIGIILCRYAQQTSTWIYSMGLLLPGKYSLNITGESLLTSHGHTKKPYHNGQAFLCVESLSLKLKKHNAVCKLSSYPELFISQDVQRGREKLSGHDLGLLFAFCIVCPAAFSRCSVDQ